MPPDSSPPEADPPDNERSPEPPPASSEPPPAEGSAEPPPAEPPAAEVSAEPPPAEPSAEPPPAEPSAEPPPAEPPPAEPPAAETRAEPAAAETWAEPTPAATEPVPARASAEAHPAEAAYEPPPAVTTSEPAPAAAKPPRTGHLRLLGVVVMLGGVILLAAGAFTWFVVRDQLSDEKITVSEDADHFGGEKVDGPLTAYAQADIINEHARDETDGLTYAQLERDDPRRETAVTASFLRASLYTSVVAFGVAAFAFGIGLLLIIIGWALLRIERSLRFQRSLVAATT
jgi:hypothetical protein